MKRNLLLIVCVGLSVMGWGQSAFGIQVGATSCGLQGQFATSASRTGFTGQLWGEWRTTDVFGLKMAAGYVQRGGAVEGARFESDFMTLHLMPRLHVADMEGKAHLLAGFGIYTNIAAMTGKSDLVKSGDFGLDAEIGFEWEYFALLIRVESSLIDVTELPKKQRWVGYGVSAQVPIYRAK